MAMEYKTPGGDDYRDDSPVARSISRSMSRSNREERGRGSRSDWNTRGGSDVSDYSRSPVRDRRGPRAQRSRSQDGEREIDLLRGRLEIEKVKAIEAAETANQYYKDNEDLIRENENLTEELQDFRYFLEQAKDDKIKSAENEKLLLEEIDELNERLERRDDGESWSVEETRLREQIKKLAADSKEEKKLRKMTEESLRDRMLSYKELKQRTSKDKRELEDQLERLEEENKELSRLKTKLYMKDSQREDLIDDKDKTIDELNHLVNKLNKEVDDAKGFNHSASLASETRRSGSDDEYHVSQVQHLQNQLKDAHKFLKFAIDAMNSSRCYDGEKAFVKHLTNVSHRINKYMGWADYVDDDESSHHWVEDSDGDGYDSNRERKRYPQAVVTRGNRVDSHSPRSTAGYVDDDEKLGATDQGLYDSNEILEWRDRFASGVLKESEFDDILTRIRNQADLIEKVKEDRDNLEEDLSNMKRKYNRSNDQIMVRLKFRYDKEPSTSIDIARKATVGMLKEKIAEVKGTMVEKVKMVFRHALLSDTELTIEECGIKDRSVVNVVISSKVMRVFGVIREGSRQHKLEFTCSPNDLLMSLKVDVFKKFYCFPEDVGIYMHDKELNPEYKLRDLGIDEGARVEIRIHHKTLSEFMDISEEIAGREQTLIAKELVMDKLKKRMHRYSEIDSYEDLAETSGDIVELRDRLKGIRNQIEKLKERRDKRMDQLRGTITRTRRAMSTKIGELEDMVPAIKKCMDHHDFKELGELLEDYMSTWQRYDILDQQLDMIHARLPDHVDTKIGPAERRFSEPSFLHLKDCGEESVNGFYVLDGSFGSMPRYKHCHNNLWVRVLGRNREWVVITDRELPEGRRISFRSNVRIHCSHSFTKRIMADGWRSHYRVQPPYVSTFFS